MLVEQGVAPAVWDSSHPRPGTPRVAVRPYYEGLPSMAGRGSGTKAAEAAPDTRGLCSPVRSPEDGSEVKNRHSGAPGGERAGHTARGAFARCQMLPSAFRRSAPSRV